MERIHLSDDEKMHISGNEKTAITGFIGKLQALLDEGEALRATFGEHAEDLFGMLIDACEEEKRILSDSLEDDWVVCDA